jgi:hypothetical protein
VDPSNTAPNSTTSQSFNVFGNTFEELLRPEGKKKKKSFLSLDERIAKYSQSGSPISYLETVGSECWRRIRLYYWKCPRSSNDNLVIIYIYIYIYIDSIHLFTFTYQL